MLFFRKAHKRNPVWGFNKPYGWCLFHVILNFVLWMPHLLCGQTLPSVKITGPTVVLTPRIVNYEILNAESYSIRWIVNRSPNISINGANNRQIVSVGLAGKGVDTLVVECTSLQIPIEKRFDTLFIRKNECPAIAGNWLNMRPRTCAGQVIEIGLDSLIGDSIHWQYSENPRLVWVQERTVRFPRQFSYTSPNLSASRFYRAIVQSGNCRDTTPAIFVRVDLTPKGAFRMTFNKSICAGEVTPNLSATTSLGVGVWQTNGKGVFSNITNPNAVYRSSTNDTGKVWLAWVVRNAGCPPERYSDTLQIRIPPKGGIINNKINTCPELFSQPLGAWVSVGIGHWLQPENGLGFYANINDPNTLFRPHISDRGKELKLRWRVRHQDCDSIYTISANIADASIAKIIYPRKNEKLEVCRNVDFTLQADTIGRVGSYQWISNQLIVDGRFSASPIVRIASGDSGIFYLAFEDFHTGCRTLDTTFIYTKTEKPFFHGVNDTICFDDRVSLRVEGIDTHKVVKWYPTSGLENPGSATPVFNPPVADSTYTFTVEGYAQNIDCPAQTIVQIHVKPTITATVVDPNNRRPNKFCTNYPNFVRIGNKESCKSWAWFKQNKQTVLATGLPNSDNAFYLTSDSILSIQNLPPNDSLYRYCVACFHEATGCTSLTDFSFEVLPVPKPSFTHEKTVPYSKRNITFQNTSEGGINYSWDFGDPQSGNNNNSQVDHPNHFFSTSGKYVITLVADNNACSKSYSDTLRVLEEEYYFPKAFTPNGDGKNDIFRPIPAFWEYGDDTSIKQIKVQSFEIYTIAGNRIFFLDHPDQWKEIAGWDGTFDNNTPAEAATYLYKVKILQEPRGIVTHTGYVTLIR